MIDRADRTRRRFHPLRGNGAIVSAASIGCHQQAIRGGAADAARLHARFDPPVLRSATIRGVMIGLEVLGRPRPEVPPKDGSR